MNAGLLGKIYADGEIIVQQGETGDCMYVVQQGQVEVFVEKENKKIGIRVMGENSFFGEMAIFEHEVRSATVRTIGETRVLTIDKNNLLRAIREDPTLAFRIIQIMSERIRDLTKKFTDSVSSRQPSILE